MTGKSAPAFLRRPEGVHATPIGGGIAAQPYKPVRAVLQTAHGGVLVRSVVRQHDGTFTGEVYGIMPREQSVARGERVRFEESQIFTFKGNDAVDADLADMQHAFEEGLRELEAQPAQGRIAARRPAREVDAGPRTASPAQVVQSRPAAVTPEPHRPAPPRPVADAMGTEAAGELGVAEAMAILCPAEQPECVTKEAPVENDLTKPAPPEQAAPHPGSQYEEAIACLECGALLPRVPPAADPAEAAGATRIACPRCGRINDIAEAEAADRQRQRAHSSP